MPDRSFSRRSEHAAMKRKERGEMEDKKDAGLPVWVWIAVLGISAMLVAGFILFLK